MFLMQPAVVLESVLIAVSAAATDTVVAVLAEQTVVVATVVSSPAVWVHHFFKDDSHQHDARPPQDRCEDQRDAWNAY